VGSTVFDEENFRERLATEAALAVVFWLRPSGEGTAPSKKMAARGRICSEGPQNFLSLGHIMYFFWLNVTIGFRADTRANNEIATSPFLVMILVICLGVCFPLIRSTI
ncbi:unnamed protein product, partial [Scytosiphon promiscuus]